MNVYANHPKLPEFQKLYSLYTLPGHPLFNADIRRLTSHFSPTLTRSEIARFLSHLPIYTRFKKKRRKHYPGNPIVILSPDQCIEVDLYSTFQLAPFNKNKNYILGGINPFTKFCHLIPIENKSGPVMRDALNQMIMKSPILPRVIRSDGGLEFNNAEVKKVYRKYGIQHKVPSRYKCPFIERLFREVGKLLRKVVLLKGTYSVFDQIELITNTLNARAHSSLPNEMSPQEAVQPENWLRIQKHYEAKFEEGHVPVTFRQPRPKFHEGDQVRISNDVVQKNPFRKSFKSANTKDIYSVIQVFYYRRLPMYRVQNMRTGKILHQKLYGHEMILVNSPVVL